MTDHSESMRAGGVAQLERDLEQIFAGADISNPSALIGSTFAAVTSLTKVRKYLPLGTEYERVMRKYRGHYGAFAFAALHEQPELALGCVEALRNTAVYSSTLEALPSAIDDPAVREVVSELKEVRRQIWMESLQPELESREQALVERLCCLEPGIWGEVPDSWGFTHGLEEAARIRLSLLVWGVFPQGSFWLLFHPPQPALIFAIPLSEADLGALVQRVLDLVSNPEGLGGAGREELVQYTRALGLDRVERALADGADLCVIPHGCTRFLPFNVLGTGRHLVERFRLSYAPSIRSLVEKRHPSRLRGRRAMLVGYSPPGRSLPEIHREILSVRQVLRECEVLLDRDATPARVADIARRFDVLHFACHGVSRADSWTESSLELARADEQSGMLTAAQILTMPLRADLVTLSACDTALGRLTEYDQVSGLAVAFLYAGAAAVLSTLWAIPDVETADFMADFYPGLIAGMRFDEALQATQRRLIDRGFPPWAWAPFTLGGYHPASWHLGTAEWRRPTP